MRDATEKFVFFIIVYGLIAVGCALGFSILFYLLVLPFKGHDSAAKVFMTVFKWSFVPLIPYVLSLANKG